MDDNLSTNLSSSDELLDDMPLDVWEGRDSDNASADLSVPVVDDDEQRQRVAVYDGKNRYLRQSPVFRELDTLSFLHLVFCRGDEDMLPFEDEWCEAYEWWTEHSEGERTAKRPPELGYVYNGIAQAIYGKRQSVERNQTYVITSSAAKIHEVLQHPFVIMSPVSYTGKRRTKTNARYLYAIAIDIDNADADNIDNLLYQSDPTRKHITFPQPQIIVNSGTGIHVYYLLETPAPMFENAYPILNKIKKELTRRVWNKGTTHENPEKPQIQGNCQGFRLPGTQTKFYTTVTAFQNINPAVPPFYAISDLAYGGGGWITEAELDLVKKGTYNPGRVSLAQARELYPEWFERRIIQGHAPNRWYIKRDLYDWWKRQVFKHATVGHRYFCLMALAVYAKKCDIPEDEFRADLTDFVDVMDGLSFTRNPEDRFTLDDALDAAAAYKEDYCTFPLDDLRAITGVPIERNRTRKFRRREEHLFDARAIRDARQNRAGTCWDAGNGRRSKAQIVYEWRFAHPDATKYACAKELGIDKKTVMKWWDTTAEDLQRYQEERRLMMESKVAAVTPIAEPHELGAAANSEYVQDKRTAADILAAVPGADKLGTDGFRDMVYDAADSFNDQIEEMIKISMGIPPEARKFIHISPAYIKEIRDEVERNTDWAEELKHLDANHAAMPEELRQMIAKATEDYGKGK